MVLRRGWVIGLGMVLAAGPAFGQAPSTSASPPPAKTKPATAAQAARVKAAAHSLAVPAGIPHTLAEALAATYSTQPALLAERAKLRATDENVPQALSGWRPTVVMAGTPGMATAARASTWARRHLVSGPSPDSNATSAPRRPR